MRATPVAWLVQCRPDFTLVRNPCLPQPGIARWQCASQVLVIRPRPTLRRHPGDDLVGILDVAGLAVHAVGGVDLQALAVLRGGVLDDLVAGSRAAAGAGVAVFFGASGDAERGVVQAKVPRLVHVLLGGG